MNARPLALCFALLGFASCKEKAAPAPEAVPPAAPVAPAPAPAPVPVAAPVEAPVAAPAAAAEARTGPGKGGKAGPGQAEVELFGNLDISKAPGKKVVLFVSKDPCDTYQPALFASMTPPNPGPPTFFLEFFPPQDSTGYLCAISIDDEGRVVGEAGHPKNPLTFKGEGEVVFDKIDLKLKPVHPTRKAPKL